ncbi:transposase [Noviherbaspirillum malthae]|uniref:transposase n=1 Tax=Noviherbaspirillum malthae TaxID=1260987 RepID=UPI00188EF58C|nr:transposase [Noviherbaspirillum malthae]
MEENHTKLRVLGHDRGGRCQYNAASKRTLVEACLRPGVSVARLAQENGINANLLRKWISRYLLERERNLADLDPPGRVGTPQTNASSTVDVALIAPAPEAIEAASTFVPIVAASPAPVAAPSMPPAPPSMTLALHVHLPNGVHFDLHHASLETASGVIHLLGRLPCSGSTQN